MKYKHLKSGLIMDFKSLISSPDWVAVDPATPSETVEEAGPGPEEAEETKKRGRKKG